MATCCEKEAINLKKMAKFTAILRAADPVRKRMAEIEEATGLNPQHTGRLYVSAEERVLQQRLEVALECCREEYCCDHGDDGQQQQQQQHHHHHHHHHHGHGCCDDADCTEARAGGRGGAPGAATGAAGGDGSEEEEDEREFDSDEELLLMGVGPDGELLLSDGDDEDDCGGRGSSSTAGPGAAAAAAAAARGGGASARVQRDRRDEFLRQHLAAAFTRDVSEAQLVRELTAAGGGKDHAEEGGSGGRVRFAFASSSSKSSSSSRTGDGSGGEGPPRLRFPVVCLVHRLRAFTEFEPSPLEATLDAALTAALCDIVADGAASGRGGGGGLHAAVAARSAQGGAPFSYCRVGARDCSNPDAALRRFLAGQGLAGDLAALPAVVCLRDAAAPAHVVCGAGPLEARFGRALVAAAGGGSGGRGWGGRGAGALTEVSTNARQWLERACGLSAHGRFGRGTGVAGGSSTHHALSAASEAALRDGAGGGAGGEEEEEEGEEDNIHWCGRPGCDKRFAHRHIDAQHLASEHNRQAFMSNEFH